MPSPGCIRAERILRAGPVLTRRESSRANARQVADVYSRTHCFSLNCRHSRVDCRKLIPPSGARFSCGFFGCGAPPCCLGGVCNQIQPVRGSLPPSGWACSGLARRRRSTGWRTNGTLDMTRRLWMPPYRGPMTIAWLGTNVPILKAFMTVRRRNWRDKGMEQTPISLQSLNPIRRNFSPRHAFGVLPPAPCP